jgi:hypothetical protein
LEPSLKYLVRNSDGRTLVKNKAETEPKKLPKHFHETIFIVDAYEERCISADETEAGLNMRLIARYVGSEHPMRKKYDPAVVGMFTPL